MMMYVLPPPRTHTPQESEDSAYVSMLWATKYLTFFHPGPIDNADVLCVHGNVNYHLGDRVADKVWRLPRSLCDEFEAQYGGDGAIDNLTPCATCEAELVEMQRRRVREDECVTKLWWFILGEGRVVILSVK